MFFFFWVCVAYYRLTVDSGKMQKGFTVINDFSIACDEDRRACWKMLRCRLLGSGLGGNKKLNCNMLSFVLVGNSHNG